MNKQKLLVKVFLLLFLSINSQNIYEDYFVYKNGDTIQCKITKAKKNKIYFNVSPENEFSIKRESYGNSAYESYYKPKRLSFYDCLYIHLSEKTKTEISVNKIVQPEDGYAHVYFYKPFVGIEPLGSFVIRDGDKKIGNIKTNSFFYIKIKAGTTHTFNTNINLFKKDEITIEAKNKTIYYIRASLSSSTNLNSNGLSHFGRNISLDDEHNPFSEVQVLSMYKKAKFYKKN